MVLLRSADTVLWQIRKPPDTSTVYKDRYACFRKDGFGLLLIGFAELLRSKREFFAHSVRELFEIGQSAAVTPGHYASLPALCYRPSMDEEPRTQRGALRAGSYRGYTAQCCVLGPFPF